MSEKIKMTRLTIVQGDITKTEVDADLVSEGGKPIARITGSKAWHHKGALKIIVR